MTTTPAFCDERVVFYKQADANFFSAYPFVLGKAISKLPQVCMRLNSAHAVQFVLTASKLNTQTAMDCIIFGTILYFMVGLGPSVVNYFIFMAILFVFSVLMNEYLFVFTTISKTKDMVQVISACLVFFFILFSGFIIAPNVIPIYYTWLYWYNPMAWAYRAIIVNEYRSAFYTEEEGDYTLSFVGFVDSNDQPFERVWVAYGFIYMVGHLVITVLLSALGLTYVRLSGESGVSDDAVVEKTDDSTSEPAAVQISFQPVTVTFEDICYDVKASTSNEQLRLLHNVSGSFESGRMCALMGSSGAGKTTLMDVVAMRKNSGTVHGDVRLNGFPQEGESFRRCSGYVEQFDVQAPQLTVRETVLFSARLRLDAKIVKTDEEKQTFCDQVLLTLELTALSDCLVGNDQEGGLSFEQRKRLSIAVELAASPSILFLDEVRHSLYIRPI
jgi:ABC-type Mn2+/Zn2+ transport system ATPase subunit